MEHNHINRRRRLVLHDSEDEAQAPTPTKLSIRRQVVLDSSEDDDQAPIAQSSSEASKSRNTRVIDLGSDSDESEQQYPDSKNNKKSSAEKSSSRQPDPVSAQVARPQQGASRRLLQGRKREFADLTGEDDNTLIVYKPITEDEARALVGMEPTQKSEVDLLEDEEDKGEEEDKGDEADDEAPSEKSRRSRR